MIKSKLNTTIIVQLLSQVWLFATPWIPAHQASLFVTISPSLFKLISIESVMPSNHIIHRHPLLLLPSVFPRIKVPTSTLFQSGGQSIETSASASVLPMNIHGWFPLELTGLISLLPKGLSRVFSTTTIAKHQFFGAQLSLWSSSHIHIGLLGKPSLWLHRSLLAKWCLCFLIWCLGLS